MKPKSMCATCAYAIHFEKYLECKCAKTKNQCNSSYLMTGKAHGNPEGC